MLPDCHTHTAFSADGGASVAELCEAAARKGIPALTVTDHCDVNLWEEQNLGQCVPDSFAAAAAHREQSPVRLLTGVELGEPLEDLEKSGWVLAHPGLDLVIGSVHNVPGRPDFYWMDFAAMTDDEIFYLFKAYYHTLLLTTEWDGFDTLAHITYPYRYLNTARQRREILLRPESFDADADAVFETLIRRGKALELNGSSLCRGEEDCALNLRYFRRYRELGGELVTFGSDAHTPAAVGQGWMRAREILLECGFHSVVYYEKRQPVMAQI